MSSATQQPSSPSIAQKIHELDPELLVADGFDSAVIGIAERCGQPSVVAYDVNKCIAALILEQGMDEIEAQEYFDFNVAGAYVGDRTPIFIHSIDPDLEQEAPVSQGCYLPLDRPLPPPPLPSVVEEDHNVYYVAEFRDSNGKWHESPWTWDHEEEAVRETARAMKLGRDATDWRLVRVELTEVRKQIPCG